MKIIEANDGIIKYETSEKVVLSSFLEVSGSAKKYIAQIIRSVYNGAGYTVFARLLFVYDGSLLSYDKTLPEINSEVAPFSFDFISKTFETPNNIIIGRFGSDGSLIRIGSDCLDKKTLVSVDNPKILSTIIVNFLRQSKKAFIIDTDGSIEAEKFYAGKDFKLPLNTAALEFIYNDCLSDATAESKSLIKDIFKDLAEYSATVPFLPFETLKTIVDDMVDKSHEFRLMVLKNKLEKFKKLGYFASTKDESEKLSEILKTEHAIIDLSGLEFGFKNKYAEIICSELENLDVTPQLFIKFSDSITKRTISRFYNSNLPSVMMVNSSFRYLAGMNSLFKNFIIEATPCNKEVFKLYRPFMNSMDERSCLFIGESSNYIPLVFNAEVLTVDELKQNHIEPKTPVQVEEDSDISQESSAETKTLMDELFEETDTYEIKNEDKSEDLSATDDSAIEDEVTDNSVEDTVLNSDVVDEGLFQSDEFHTHTDNTKIETEEEFSENNTYIVNNTDDSDIKDETLVELTSEEVDSDIIEVIENSISDDKNNEKTDTEIVEEDSQPEDDIYELDEAAQLAFEQSRNIDVSELKIMPLQENSDDITGEITELKSEDFSDDDILVELNDDLTIEEDDNNALDKEIIKDVDKVYTTVKDDSVSDMDLDFIDELNELDSDDVITDEDILSGSESDIFEELSLPQENEEDFLEPLAEVSDNMNKDASPEILETKKSSTPIVPVYDAEIPPEDRVVSDPIEQGDTVVHAKYGTGVVEKMIKYGNKNLYSINFDNVGRRLLDPALTEIKKN